MTDDAPRPISRDFRTGVAVATLGLAYTGIGLLLWLGDDGNALHVSGLTALVWSSLAILIGIGVSSSVPAILDRLKG